MRLTLTRTTIARLTLLFAAWTVYGLLSAWQTHYWYSFSRKPMSWPDCLRFEMSYGYIWWLCTPAILWLADRYRFDRSHVVRNLTIHIAAMTIFIVVTKTAFDAFIKPPESSFIGFEWQKLFRSIESTSDTGVLFYWVIVLVEHSIVYYARYQHGLVNASRLQTQLAKAQLQALKMQLHPHFLFNTLNTITALVHEDPDTAERTIARLGELLRLFLANSMIHEVALSEELRILDLYLDIERTRFEDRLSVHKDIPPELSEAMVPNLVLQPLVENAIRHGLSQREGPGWIAISAEKFGETLVLRVTDNGAGPGPDLMKPSQGGMGLSITRNRLESLYGPHQSLVLRGLQTGGAEVRITMPFRTYAAAEKEEDHAALQSIDR